VIESKEMRMCSRVRCSDGIGAMTAHGSHSAQGNGGIDLLGMVTRRQASLDGGPMQVNNAHRGDSLV